MKEADEIKNQAEFEREFPKQINYIVERVFNDCLELAKKFRLDEVFVIEKVCERLHHKKRKQLL